MKNVLIALGGVAVGLAGGILGARQILIKKMEEEYQIRLEDEVAKTTAFLNEKFKAETLELVNQTLEKRDGKPRETPEDDSPATTEQLEKVVTALRYGPQVGTVAPAKPTGSLPKRNVFEQPDKKKHKTGDGPFIIDQELFLQEDNERSVPKITLTWFAGDGVLSDESDEPIEDIDHVVGRANLDRFGHKSNDSRVVYIRNHKLGADYEVLLHDGMYAEVVAGEVNTKRNRT